MLLHAARRFVVENQLQKRLFRPLRLLVFAIKAFGFLFLASDILKSAPASLFECEATTSVRFAESLWQLYIAFFISDLATSLVAVLSGAFPAGALIRNPPTYW
jgi:hypothetical protein